MNRPIKFRVRDVQQNKFLPSYGDLGIQFYHEQGKDWHEKQVRDIVPVSWFLQDHNNNLGNYIVQQYTGLTDKNGKEIYEGDIIHLKFGELNANLVVKWDKYMGLKYHNGGWTSLVHVDAHGEVIGNIFENSELPN